MSVSKRLRYEVLRRDDHACRYCGAKAPDARLTVDHVIPVALGGGDDPSNLVTACAGCNSGKSSVPVEAPLVDQVADDALRWAKAMRHAADAQRAQRDLVARYTEEFEVEWNSWSILAPGGVNTGEKWPLPSGWQDSVANFYTAGIEIDVVFDAIGKAMRKIDVRGEHGKFRYTCGVLWRLLDERQAMAKQIIDEGTA